MSDLAAGEWEVEAASGGLRLREKVNRRRVFGTEQLSWNHLLYRDLAAVRVFVLYFPSRFDQDLDEASEDALHLFGENTGAATSVNFWDSRDERFSDALGLFGVKQPPALVLVSGLRLPSMQPRGPDETPLWAIAFTEPAVIGDTTKLASAVNQAHELLIRGDPDEIVAYARKRKLKSVLAVLFRGGGVVRDEFLKLKPKLILPGGFTLGLG